jgi:hypothetical protein
MASALSLHTWLVPSLSPRVLEDSIPHLAVASTPSQGDTEALRDLPGAGLLPPLTSSSPCKAALVRRGGL